MKILWLESLEPKQIALSQHLFKKLSEPESLVANLGSLKITLDPMKENKLSEDTIGLPKSLSDVYTIPTDIPYECYVKNQEIHIGPFIAHVAKGSFKDLKEGIYYSILPKFLKYSSIKGLVIICTRDSIDVDSEIIEGYYFDPKGEEPEKVWKYGKFPLPNAIFNRSYMSQKKISLIQSKIGNTVFNSYWYNLNKWKLWVNLSKDEVLKKHLPYTERLSRLRQVENLVNIYGSVYLKPFKKSRGRGILKVTKLSKGYVAVNIKKQKFYFNDFKSLSKFLKTNIKIPYIIQQSVSHMVDNQCLDFRLILQKNDSKNWIFSGLMGRIAPVDGIITNMQGNPKTMRGREVLKNYYKLSDEAADNVEKKMTNLIIKAVEKYEEKGFHLGDLAADIILDSSLHIWLLELQLNHAIYGNTAVLPPEFFEKVLTTPFQYAKTLAGFDK